jgi:hypothetical protein
MSNLLLMKNSEMPGAGLHFLHVKTPLFAFLKKKGSRNLSAPQISVEALPPRHRP